MKFLMSLCFYVLTFIVSVLSVPRHRIRDRDQNRVSSPLDNLVHKVDAHNYWLKSQLKKEHSTLYEIPEYPNDGKSSQNAWSQMNKHEEEMNLNYMNRASINVKNVLNTGKCKIPTRRCLDMHRMNSGSLKSYWPPCALVHKCEHDSGCCIAQRHVCSPIKTEPIDLYFFSFTAEDHGSKAKRGRVERFTFENHTECGCRPASIPSYFETWNKNSINTITSPIKKRSCQCPKHFIPTDENSECTCTCNKKQTRTCKRIRKGKRSYHYKGCKGGCDPPSCEYGEYKKEFGRCPRKSEQKKRRRS